MIDNRTKMVMAVSNYDLKQSTKPGFNPYALPQYLHAVDRVMEDLESGIPLRQAIVRNLTGRLATAVLKAVGEPALTREEARA